MKIGTKQSCLLLLSVQAMRGAEASAVPCRWPRQGELALSGAPVEQPPSISTTLQADRLDRHGNAATPPRQAGLHDGLGAAQAALSLPQLPIGHQDAPHKRGQRLAQRAVHPCHQLKRQLQLGRGLAHLCTTGQRGMQGRLGKGGSSTAVHKRRAGGDTGLGSWPCRWPGCWPWPPPICWSPVFACHAKQPGRAARSFARPARGLPHLTRTVWPPQSPACRLHRGSAAPEHPAPLHAPASQTRPAQRRCWAARPACPRALSLRPAAAALALTTPQPPHRQRLRTQAGCKGHAGGGAGKQAAWRCAAPHRTTPPIQHNARLVAGA